MSFAEFAPAEFAPAEATSGSAGDLTPAGAEASPRAKGPADYSIDTIRVPANKLDSLMSHAGELAVTRGRIAHRVVEIEHLISIWEEWNRDFYSVRAFATQTNEVSHGENLNPLNEHAEVDREPCSRFYSLFVRNGLHEFG